MRVGSLSATIFGFMGDAKSRGIIPPPTASCHRNDVIIHGPILARRVGHRLSNPLKNPPVLRSFAEGGKAEIRRPEKF
jgi:hypothetical protein